MRDLSRKHTDLDTVDFVINFDQNDPQLIAFQSYIDVLKQIVRSIEGNGELLEWLIQQLQITQIEFMRAKDGDLNNPILIVDFQVHTIFTECIDFSIVGKASELFESSREDIKIFNWLTAELEWSDGLSWNNLPHSLTRFPLLKTSTDNRVSV